jgi:heme A synthase
MLVRRLTGSTVHRAEELLGSPIAKLKSTPVTTFETGPRPVARFAWFVVAYNIAVILWGAYVRATGSGAGCGSHWPLCNGAILPATTRIQTVIEFTHRVTSAVSLVLVMILLIWCWRRGVTGAWPRYSATAAAALLFNEALLGALLVLSDRIGGLDRSAAHAVFLCLHFGNTLLLLAALALTAKWLSNPSRHYRIPAKFHERTFIWLGLLSVMVIGMTGSLASLGDTIFPPDSLRHALMQDFSASSHILLRLRLLHPVAAVVGSTYVFWLLWSLWRTQEHSPWMFGLAAALITQITLGALNVILLAPIWLQMTHLLVAELVWILLVLASAELLLVDCGGLARGRTQVPQLKLRHDPDIPSNLRQENCVVGVSSDAARGLRVFPSLKTEQIV